MLRYFKLIMFLFLLAGVVSCNTGGAPGQQGPRAILAEGYRVDPEEYSFEIRATGELLSLEEVELRAPVAGNVLSINFQEGQYVGKGHLLVEIDSRTWQAQMKGLEAQLIPAKNDYERKKQLLEIEGASMEEVDQARALVIRLESQIEELKVRIDLAHIRAPFSGRLGMRDFSLGAFLSQGDVVTRLVQTGKLRVSFTIPARYAREASPGMDVRVISRSSGDTVMARVYAVDPFISSSTRSLQVRASFDNSRAVFIPGDFAEIILNSETTDDALLIPAEAIIPELNAQIIYLAKNGKAIRTPVETGVRTQNMVLITNGISPGDTILVTGLMEVRNGSAVQITDVKTKEAFQ